MSEPTIVLAEHKGLGRVYLCSCESVHLKVGPVTLCLAPEAFAQAAEMMRDALEELARMDGSQGGDQDSIEDFPLRTRFMN